MNIKNSIILKLLALLLIPITLFSGCDKRKAQLQQTFDTYSSMLEEGRVDELKLKIYYISEEVFFCAPLSVDKLIHSSYTQMIVVEGEELKSHIDLLKDLKAEALTPVREESYLDARLCYIFETMDGEKVLEVASYGATDNYMDALSENITSGNENLTGMRLNVFVNGIAVEHNDILYEVIKPFCSEELWQNITSFPNLKYST